MTNTIYNPLEALKMVVWSLNVVDIAVKCNSCFLNHFPNM